MVGVGDYTAILSHVRPAADATKKMSYVIKSCPFGVRFWRCFIPFICIHGSLDKVLVHDSDQGVIFIKAKLSEERFANLTEE